MQVPVTWNGLQINSGDWVTNEIGFLGSAAAVASTGQLTQADGVWRTRAYRGALSGTLSGTYIGTNMADVESKAAILTATADINPVPLTVRFPNGPRTIYIARDSALDIKYNSVGTCFTWSTTVIAPDPVWWSGGQTGDGGLSEEGLIRHTLRLPNITGGLTWPIKWPVKWNESGNTGDLNIYLESSARIRFTIHGPVDVPLVIVNQKGKIQRLKWDYKLLTGDELIVDPRSRTSRLNSGTLISPVIREWPTLDSGAAQISFRCEGDINVNAKMVIDIRPTFGV